MKFYVTGNSDLYV